MNDICMKSLPALKTIGGRLCNRLDWLYRGQCPYLSFVWLEKCPLTKHFNTKSKIKIEIFVVNAKKHAKSSPCVRSGIVYKKNQWMNQKWWEFPIIHFRAFKLHPMIICGQQTTKSFSLSVLTKHNHLTIQSTYFISTTNRIQYTHTKKNRYNFLFNINLSK